MKFLSISSLWLYTVRTITVIGIAIAYLASDKSEVIQTNWTIQTNDDVTSQCSNGSESYRYTNLSQPLDAHTSFATITISESMCIYSGDMSGFEYDLGYVSESGLFGFVAVNILEGLMIPLIQMPNLRFASYFAKWIGLKKKLQGLGMKDKRVVKAELMAIMKTARTIHGGNLTAVGWIVFWTFIGNGMLVI